MFQPETEDMLPRCAPKPSVPFDMNTAAIVRPVVPEVSILLGSQQTQSTNAGTTSTAAPETPQQTYAAWKKQILPKVSFPPAGAEVYSINGHVVSSPTTLANNSTNTQVASHLYPLRPITANVAPTPTSGSSTAVACVNAVTAQMQQYRRSLEQPLCIQENVQRRSLDASTTPLRTHEPSRDVLTICAGTQSDPVQFVDSNKCDSALLARLATKEDFQELLTIFGEMRREQLRLVNVMDTLFRQQQSQQTVSRQNAATQYTVADFCEPQETPALLHRRQYEIVEDNRRYQQIKEVPAYLLESPRHPAAQSTAYQAPTPPTANVMPNKQSTEKSLLMNELALKYLPSEQLNEMLHELNIAPRAPQQATTPLRPIENMENRPSDISNASYKYLKKYRLLPVEHDEEKEGITPMRSPLPQVARQQQQQEQSPYQQAQLHTASPRAATTKSPMLDLENIRRQPKLI